MHLISRMVVRNFRSVKETAVSLSPYTALIGCNNAGKSNLLKALIWLLRKSTLSANDFRDINSSVVVEGQISGLNEEILSKLEKKHRDKISEFVEDGTVWIRRTQPSPSSKSGELVLDVRKPSANEWSINPTGIENAISVLFPEPIVINAMQDAAEDLTKFGSKTTIGLLLTEISSRIKDAYSAEVEQALSQIREKLSANGNQKSEHLRSIDEKINTEIKKFFPGIEGKTHIPVPSLDDFIKSGPLKIFDPSKPDLTEGQQAAQLGHGSQRAIQIALINCLAKIRTTAENSSNRTTLLVIDEPELYLHPQAIERVRVALKGLAESEYQVCFSTHSANMIAREDAPNVTFVRWSPEAGTNCRNRLEDAVLQLTTATNRKSELLFSLTHSTSFLFADKVIICEGKTEKYLIPDMYKTAVNMTMGEAKTALLTLGGSESVMFSLSVLSSMGMPTKAIVDLDYAFKHASKNSLLEPDDEDYLKCKKVLKDLENLGEIRLDGSGHPENSDFCSAEQAYNKLANTEEAIQSIIGLHKKLIEKNIWLWTLGSIEYHLNISGKNDKVWLEFTEKLKSSGDFSFTKTPEEIARMFEWITS